MLYAYNQSVSDENAQPPVVPFLWDGTNYLTKMKSDMNFLAEHSLAKYFNFSDKADPFLVIPSCAHTGVGLKGLKKVRKKQAKKKLIKDDNKYEVPLDNSLMQRIKASEIIIERETKGGYNDDHSSPGTNKTIDSPNKSDIKMSNAENQDPNGDADMASNKRESLFDIRKRKGQSTDNLHSTDQESETPKQSNDKVMHPETNKPEPIKEVVEPVEEDMDEDFEYSLYPISLQESELVSFITKYNLKIDENLAKSYCQPNEILSKFQAGNNAQIYGIRNKGSTKEIDGLFIYSLDSHFDRLNIFHLSTVSKKGLDAAIVLSLAHIWSKENAHEIRMGLYHYDEEKDGKVSKVVYTDLKDSLKKNKLKWKNILNEGHDRLLVMGAIRSDGREAKNELDEVLNIRSGLLLSTSEEHPGIGNFGDAKNLHFVPGLYLNSLISEKVIENEEHDEEHHKLFQEIISTVQNSKTDALPLTVSKKDSDAKVAIEDLKAEGIEIDSSKINSGAKSYHSNGVSIDTKLLAIDNCIHKVQGQNYNYLRIKCKELVMVGAPNVSTEIYFMPVGTRQSFGLLLFKKPSDQRFNSNIDLFNFCKNVISEMQEVDAVETSGLYLP
jgi:hypothetical protein